jgi:hypothetical protein
MALVKLKKHVERNWLVVAISSVVAETAFSTSALAVFFWLCAIALFHLSLLCCRSIKRAEKARDVLDRAVFFRTLALEDQCVFFVERRFQEKIQPFRVVHFHKFLNRHLNSFVAAQPRMLVTSARGVPTIRVSKIK